MGKALTYLFRIHFLPRILLRFEIKVINVKIIYCSLLNAAFLFKSIVFILIVYLLSSQSITNPLKNNIVTL